MWLKSATENEYLDVIAHCTDAGEVVVYPSHLAVMDCDDKKLRKQRKVRFSIISGCECCGTLSVLLYDGADYDADGFSKC